MHLRSLTGQVLPVARKTARRCESRTCPTRTNHIHFCSPSKAVPNSSRVSVPGQADSACLEARGILQDPIGGARFYQAQANHNRQTLHRRVAAPTVTGQKNRRCGLRYGNKLSGRDNRPASMKRRRRRELPAETQPAMGKPSAGPKFIPRRSATGRGTNPSENHLTVEIMLSRNCRDSEYSVNGTLVMWPRSESFNSPVFTSI